MEAELQKLETNLSGVASMQRLPDALFVTDLKVEEIGVREASRLNIPAIGPFCLLGAWELLDDSI